MSRLMDQHRGIQTVNVWNTEHYFDDHSCLAAALNLSQAGELFSNIYIPIRSVDATGMHDVQYENIGLTAVQLADIYANLYGFNYLVEPFVESNNPLGPYTNCTVKLANRCNSVLNANKYKYLKLIELAGYAYNPIWNVDGTETFTTLDNDGSVTDSGSQTLGSRADSGSITNDDTDHNVTAFDSNNPALADQTKHGAQSSNTIGQQINSNTVTTTHTNALNNGVDYSGGVDAFGNTVIGGDHYHTEGRIRQGNIGVTATQDLIAKERLNVQFSIVMEFFRDLNEQVLVGIY